MVTAVIFDAYGTLLDVHSAMQRHAGRLGENWQAISAEWRARQLEYTWVRSLAGEHRDFARLTDEALRFVAARHGIDDPALLSELRDAYDALDAYAEVPALLATLHERGLRRVVLSNGSPPMLAHATRAAGIDTLLDAVISVEEAGVFKPHPSVYRLATERLDVEPGELAFVSSNAWDAFGARLFGFRVFWVNRSHQPDEYDLARHVTVLSDLSGLPEQLRT